MYKILWAFAAFCLTWAGPAYAQPEYNETGWRAATGQEKALRKVYEDAKGSWSKSHDKIDMYGCLNAWVIWADTARDTNDSFPTISGDLSHAFAEGQLSHYLNSLYTMENGNDEAFATNFLAGQERVMPIMGGGNINDTMRLMGKCFVHPASWSFSQGITLTGPQFMARFFDKPEVSKYPPYVKNRANRDRFDQLILQKDFAGAANFAAKLHGNNEKSTVYWHEVLAASELAMSTGRGYNLDNNLLKVLGDVWWPKYKRGWAKNILRVKRGEPDPTRPKLHDPGDEPAWAAIERRKYLNGDLNYRPCNVWNDYGC